VEGRLYLLWALDTMRSVLLCMLEVVEGGFSFEVPKIPFWQFFSIQFVTFFRMIIIATEGALLFLKIEVFMLF